MILIVTSANVVDYIWGEKMGEINCSGKWRFKNSLDEFLGELYIDKESRLIQIKLYYTCNWGDYKIDYKKSKIITGSFTNGFKITLLDLEFIRIIEHGMSNKVIVFNAKYAFQGLEYCKQDDLLFSKIDYKVEELMVWSGLNGFNYAQNGNSDFNLTYCKKESYNFTLYDDTIVEIGGNLNRYPLDLERDKVELIQSVWISIKSKNKNNIKYFQEVFRKIISLVAVGMGGFPKILEVVACKEKEFSMNNHPISINCTNINIFETSKVTWDDYLFYLKDLVNEERSIFDVWIKKYDKLIPIVELYLSLICNKNVSLNRYFLTLIQALEGYHRRFICNDKADFIKRIDMICGKDIQKEKQYICSYRQKTEFKYITLESRLMDLLLAEFKIVFINNYKKIENNFVKRIVNTRNYLTHYDLNKEMGALRGDELDKTCRYLKLVLEYYILLEIGIDTKKINEVVEKRIDLLKNRFR